MTQLFEIKRTYKNERNQTDVDKTIKSYRVHIKFHDVNIAKPVCTTYTTGAFNNLYPGHARLTGLPYSGVITLGATTTIEAYFEDGHVEEKEAEIPSFQIGSFPTMVGGSNCHTTGCSQTTLKGLGEDPNDQGGYFVAKRHEYVVDLLENIKYNSAHIHIKVRDTEHVRAEFLSQPGGAFDNSSQIRVRYMVNGQITIEINSTKFEDVKLPFYIIYRLFGMMSDRDIIETIAFDADDGGPITIKIMEILERAFKLSDATFADMIHETNREKLVLMTAERISRYLTANQTATINNESAIQFIISDLLGSPDKSAGFDKILLPHMGDTYDSRIRKLKFLGLMIRKILLVHLGILPPTDRDSYRNKRVHGAGVSLAKAFKTQVNNSVISPILKMLKKDFKNNPWASITSNTIIETFRGAFSFSDLNRAMEQSITSGNKNIVIKRKVSANRVSSQTLERKNILNVVSNLRSIVAQNGSASNSTERANQMRRVHPTYIGMLCVAQSAPSGENVGLKKQLGLTAGVSTAGNPITLKLHLLSDKDIIPLDRVASNDLIRQKMANVSVNGEWIGACFDMHKLSAKYRALRREGRVVEPKTTIHTNPITNEVEFWLDVGRLYRPLLIVDNNIEEYDRAIMSGSRIEFVQNIRFTKDHVKGIIEKRITLEDLLQQGIAEYITAEEQENCLIAESINKLRLSRNDITLQYTHCDIEQAIFGLPAHVSPFGNHTQPARVTFESEQSRQTGGWHALNFPFRADKNKFFQFYNETPLVCTITQKFVPANGVNIMIAYMSYGGDNQEDSAIVSQASADRGLFAGAFFRYEMAELEKNDVFCNPNMLTTKNIKSNAKYEKLVDGFITVGSVVEFGDVLIGRVSKISKSSKGAGDEQYTSVDKSIVYRQHEPAVVEEVLRPHGANDELFAIVKLRFERPLRVGDKLSSRSGNKCLTPDHQVLTQRGWIPIAEVTVNDDVCSLDPANGTISYDKPTLIHTYDVDDYLFEVENSEVSLRTTLNHRMYAKLATDAESTPFRFIEAQTISGNVVFYKKDGISADAAAAQAELMGMFPDPSGSRFFYKTSSAETADDMQKLALHAGWVANIRQMGGEFAISLDLSEEGREVSALGYTSLNKYVGPVHCLTMPHGTFYVRRNGLATWTGNSIVASMLQQSDMPFTESGLVPDLIMNTHSFPSRMTMGQLIETSMGKICASKGVITDGTSFLPVDHSEIAKNMRELGFRYNGCERMYNGMTGEYFDAAIFMGPTMEQRLQKFVLDEEQVVSRSGPTDATTGQPLGGKHIQGGLRIGEMENWVLAAHGSMRNLYEKYSIDSDGRITNICRVCGVPAIYNNYLNIYQCHTCGEMADISTVETTKSAILVQEELAASNIRMRLGLRPRGFDTHK
jgi:DNA-directed RNA polymerase beta subunit